MGARRTFGHTWWGQAWLDALEGRAVYDPNRLPRGRTYARQGRARIDQIIPGSVHAEVDGSLPDSYDVTLFIRQFRDDEWDCVLDAIVGRAAYAAALLDGELDPGIVEEARAVEVEVLPKSGDLRTSCTCPDDAEPCKHAAAVCYVVADALDEDPFAIFAIRGRSRQALLDEVRARRAAVRSIGNGKASASAPDAADAANDASNPESSKPATSNPADAGSDAAEDDVFELPPEGVLARDAWAREVAPLPSLPAVPERPGRPAPWPSDPPPDASFDGHGLRLLAADAARRAWAMRADGEPSHLRLSGETDLARRAATATETELQAMAFRAGMTPSALQSEATAWEVGGAEGVEVLDARAWMPPPTEMAGGRDVLLEAGVGERSIRIRSNRITVDGTVQFRRDRRGRWWRFEKLSGRWMLTAPAAEEIDDLLELPGI